MDWRGFHHREWNTDVSGQVNTPCSIHLWIQAMKDICRESRRWKLGPCSQSYGFSSSHVWMWELDYKEGWAPKNWCLQTVVLEKALESPLYNKEIKPVNPRGDQSWVFTGRTDAKTEAPILGPPDAKGQLAGKDSDTGKDWGQEEKGVTEDEMVSWIQ